MSAALAAGGQLSNDSQRRSAASAPIADQCAVVTQKLCVGSAVLHPPRGTQAPVENRASIPHSITVAGTGIDQESIGIQRADVDPGLMAAIQSLHREYRNLLRRKGDIQRMIAADERSLAVARLRLSGKELPPGKMPDVTAADREKVRVLRARYFRLLDAAEAECEGCGRELANLAKALPVSEWVKGVRGFGLVSLGAIIGEAGDLSAYSTPSKLWKRLGLAVMDGSRQGRVGDLPRHEKKAAWIAHGYNPERRSVTWVMADSLFKHQWRGEKEGVAAHPIGPYGEVYGQRKAHTLPRIEATAELDFKNPDKWTPKRCDNDARRVMTKKLVLDLWRAWRSAITTSEPKIAMPTAT